MSADAQHGGIAARGGAWWGGLIGLAVLVVVTVLVGDIAAMVFAPVGVGLGGVVGAACGGRHPGRHTSGRGAGGLRRRSSAHSIRGRALTVSAAHGPAGLIPSRSGILGRSLLLGLVGGAMMGQVALVVLAIWLVGERL